MAMFRKFFYRKPPDGLLEISERLYVFDCCFTTEGWEAENYKVYVGGIIGQLRDHFPDASLLVFNFREEETQSQMAVTLSDYDMTIMDYPRQYEGCPLLTMEVIHHFLRSSESWLSLGPQNVLLMHCERGGWPVLAFMLAALLIYRKQYSGEHKTLEMVYKQAPHELLQLLSPLNPLPSQLRYLQYVSRRNVASEWPPLDRALTLDCIILRLIPNFGGEGGCRPIFRVYGQDPFLVADRTPKVLYSTPKRSKTVRLYKQAECELVKIDINSHIQGDVVLECISLNDDLEREEMMFRAMFNTAFIRSNILILNRDEIDTLWNAKDQFPKEFRAEVLFSEMDAAASIVLADLSCFEEKEGLPIEAFAKVQEIFSHVDWLDPKTDAALNVLHQLTASNIVHEKLDTYSHQSAETMPFPQELSPEKLWEKQKPTELEINPKSPAEFGNNSKSPTAVQNLSVPPLNLTPGEIAREKKVHLQYEQVVLQPPSQSEEICQQTPQSSQSNPVFCNSVQSTPVSVPRCHSAPSAFGIFPLEQEDASSRSVEVTHSRTSLDVPPLTPDISCIPASSEQKSISISPPTPPSPPPLQPFASACSAQTLPSPPPPPPTPPHFSASKLTHPSVAKNPETYLEGRGQPSLAGFQTAPGPISPGKTFNESSYDSPLHALDSNPSPPKRQLPPNPPSPPMITPPRLTTLRTPPPPPTPALKERPATRAGPPPPPPPPLRTAQAAGPAISSLGPPPPPTPPLKERPAIRSGPPPPPPPPLRTVQAADPAISSLGPPPPPPAPTLKPASQNSTRVPSAPPPSRGPSFSSPSTAKGRGLSRTISPRNHQIKKLKPLHWLKLTRAAQGSLWAEAQKSGEASKAPEIDMSELESLFSATVTNSGHGSSGGKSNLRTAKSDIVQLIDHRRAYNCEIMLSKVKVPLHDLMSSVLALEDSALDVDQVDNLIKFCPTNEEMELLKGYSGQKEKLGKCEQFFLELMQVPRVESKLRVFSFKIQFRSQLSDLRTGLNVVNSAAEEMRTSVKLKRIMQTILSLGNALNQGTARGSAIGFRLDSLLKLTDTRAKNNKMTLMHYLCKVVADKLPELLDFSKDLASLEAASRIQLKYLAEEMQAVSKGLEKVVQELSLSENDGPVSENFRKTLKEFLSFAEAEVRSLALLYSGVGKHVDALILYFGEDPSRCPFEQVVSTLQNFVRMFKQAHEENCKQLELEKKKAEKESNIEKLKIAASTGSGHLLHTPVK